MEEEEEEEEGEGALETVWSSIFNYTDTWIFDSNNSPDEQK